jgi:lysyl-tRNA synthetase class 2
MPSDSQSGQSGETLARIISERREKVAALRQRGQNPYRNDFFPTTTAADVRRRYANTQPNSPAPGIQPVDGEVIRLAGRLTARRGFGKTVFAPIRDRSGDLQLFLSVDHLAARDFEEVLPLLDVGDYVGAEGPVFWTKRGELSLLCKRLVLITKSLRPLPDKWHGLTDVELRYRQRYLDLATNLDVREVFLKRSRIVAGVRSFLDARDFVEVETPMMHPIVSGAAARPFTTHHNALDLKLYMRIAPELYLKRLVVGGLERVYEINRNFRNEGLSRQHNPEFTMLEFYQAYANYHDLMELTEQLISGLAREINGSTVVNRDNVALELAPPWRRVSVQQAVVEHGRLSARIFDDPVAAAEAASVAGIPADEIAHVLLEGLSSDKLAALGGLNAQLDAFRDGTRRPAAARAIVERYEDALTARVCAGHLGYLLFERTAESALVQPTFLTDFPLAVSPLARKNESDPAYCDRFELLVNGTEIANAFSELNDPDDQRQRFVAQLRAREVGAGETMDYDEDYCRALELGMPPAAGEGIGIDRLTMLLTGQPSIRDVILFPLMRPE